MNIRTALGGLGILCFVIVIAELLGSVMGGLSLQKTWLLVVVGGALIFAAGSNRTPLKLWVARGSVLVLALFAFFLAFSFAQEVSEESALIVFLAVGVPVFVALYSLSLLYLLFKSR